MGTDIHGHVECRAWAPGLEADQTVWQAAIALPLLGVRRDYAAFGSLFGVRNSAPAWEPIAAARGLPADVSETVRAEHAAWIPAAFGATWLGWAEVLAVDWDEPAPTATDIARYRRRPDGTLELRHRDDWSRGFARASGVDTLTVGPDQVGVLWDEGTEWDLGTTVFRVMRARRRETVPADGMWQPVWETMRALARVHGDGNVRLVVWFDE